MSANERGYIHRNPDYLDELVCTPSGGERTLSEVIHSSFKAFPTSRCLGTRDSRGRFQWKSYTEVGADVAKMSSAMHHIGYKPGERIAVYTKNRAQSTIVELTCWVSDYTSVYLYDTLGPESIQYVLNDSQASAVFCSSDKLPLILPLLPQLPNVRYVVSFDDIEESSDSRVLTYAQLVADAGHPLYKPTPPAPENLATILYTSGTTGPPKGVLMTHSNFMASLGAAQINLPMNPSDSVLSYLPMAHVFEKLVQLAALAGGASIGFYNGDPKTLIEDVAALKPTIFCGVPRVYQKIYDKVHAQVAEGSFIKRKLFNYAYSSKAEGLKQGVPSPYLDSLVFNKIKEKLGGNVRLVISGAAPLSSPLHEFLEICMCCPVVQGYGLSETTAGGTITPSSLYDDARGHVGLPAPCTEVVLESVPSMSYTVRDKPYPRGEVLLRGPNVFKGYHNLPDKTREAFTEDGWFRTGDIGQWNPNGTLSIIDRKKNIFKLSQGEYVAVEKVENAHIRNRFVGQLWVYGDSTQDYLVAVVVPDPDQLVAWARKALSLSSRVPDDQVLETAVGDPRTEAMVVRELQEAASQAKLQGFERIRRVHFEKDEWTPEGGLVTPTQKTKRPQMLKHYRADITRMYAEGPNPPHFAIKAKL